MTQPSAAEASMKKAAELAKKIETLLENDARLLGLLLTYSGMTTQDKTRTETHLKIHRMRLQAKVYSLVRDCAEREYSEEEERLWVKVELLLGEVEMTLNTLVNFSQRLSRGKKEWMNQTPKHICENFMQVARCMEMIFGLELD